MSQKSELWSLVPAGDVNDQSWRARINLWGESTGLQGRESPHEHFLKIPQTSQYSSLILRAKFISRKTVIPNKDKLFFVYFQVSIAALQVLRDEVIFKWWADHDAKLWRSQAAVIIIAEQQAVKENDKIPRVLRTVPSGWEAYCALSSPLCQLQLWNRFFQNNPSAEESWHHHGLGQTQKWQTFWLSL